MRKFQKQINPRRHLIRIYHMFMIKYGWIDYQKFMELPMPLSFALLEELRFDFEEEEKEMRKIKNR